MDEDEKTEEPTPKKIEQAKEEGNVPKSAEVVGAATLFFGSLYLLFFSSFSFTQIEKMMMFVFNFIGQDMTDATYYSLTFTLVTTLIYALAPFYILIVFLVLIFNWMQFGFISTPIKLKLEKINPLSGFKSIFGLKKLLEALKLMAKLTVIVIVMCVVFLLLGDSFLHMMEKELNGAIAAIIELITYFLAAILLIIIIFAIMDFYFTRHYYFKSLKMSKQEIKDEFKNMEGDPQVKGRIRKIQMQMAMQRMMSDVPDSDVVITNPTHYSVALKYDNQVDQAPKIIAKGIDFLALRIRDVAKENQIPIIENPALARALYDQIEVDQTIPEEFYKAIAEIFSYVYELKNK